MATQARHYGGAGPYGGPISGPGNRTTVIAVKKLLERARPKVVFLKVAEKTRVPLNKADTVAWRRAVNGAISTTTLTEGVTPESQALVYEDVTKQLEEYGLVYEITSRQRELGEDNAVVHSSEILADQCTNIKERVCWEEAKLATNIVYADPTNDTSIADVSGPITGGAIQMMVRTLTGNVAHYYTDIDRGGLNEGTVTVEASFIAVCHTDLEPDLRAIPGFVTVDMYGGRSMVCEDEFGSYQNVRFVTTPYHVPIIGAGAAVGALNMKAVNATNIDVYPVIVMGKHAFGCVDLLGMEGRNQRGYGGVKINTIGGATKDDPLNQRTYVSARWWDAPKILNNAWIAQGLFAATDDLTVT